MWAILLFAFLIFVCIMGAGPKPKTEEELKNNVLKYDTSHVTITKFILMFLFR